MALFFFREVFVRSIENPDRLSAAGLVLGVVEGIRFRARSDGLFITDWVVLGVRDEDGDYHELQFNAELFAEIGGIAKLGELNGAKIAGVAVHADFFGAPGGEPVRVSQEMIWILAGSHAGRILRSCYQTSPNGRIGIDAARNGSALKP